MYQSVNGINLYYEMSGSGEPFILLHGNGESHKIFDRLILQLSGSYRVYAIDSRGHGKSSKVKSLDYETMSEDIAEFITKLKLNKPILYGFSDGGILGLMIAYKYPDMLSKLIISGANAHPSGIINKYLRVMKLVYGISRSNKFKLMLTQPDISDEELGRIKAQTLVLAGSNDMIKEEHTRHMAECIPGSKLQIIEGEDHMSYVVHSLKLYDIIKPFIEENSEND